MSNSFTEWAKNQNIDLVISKKKRVEMLFDEIENAQKGGAKIWHLVQWLKQAHDLDLTEQYLQTALYRIRKERGGTSNNKKVIEPKKTIEVIPTATIKNQDDNEYTPENWEKILDKFYAENNPHDRYLALGGKLEDIDGKSLASKRDMTTQLKHKLERKYKRIY
jgi:hypothetical protein